MARPSNKALKYRERLDRLRIPYEQGWDEHKLKEVLDAAAGGAMQGPRPDPGTPPEKTDDEAGAEIDTVVNRKLAELERQLADMRKALSTSGGATLTPELIREIGRLAKDEVKDGLVNPEFIKPEDELLQAKVYYRVGPTHNIWFVEKAGVRTPLPYGIPSIKFELASGWVSRTGSAIQQRRVSVFVTKNRKIAECIESLPEFGKSIHIERDRALRTSVTGEFMELYNKHLSALQGVPMHLLTEMASDNEIPTSMGASHHEYATQIAEKLALREARATKDQFEARMREFDIDKMLQA